MRLNPYSITVLVAAGFLLVALPLVFAILSTHTLTGQLARTTSTAFSAGVQSARDAQILLEQMSALERNARQYQVVSDPALLILVHERHARILDILGRLDVQLDGATQESAALRTGLAALVSSLEGERANADVRAFERLHADARNPPARSRGPRITSARVGACRPATAGPPTRVAMAPTRRGRA